MQAVRFADDQAMIASSVNGLQNIMTKLNNRVKDYKMKINGKKTKVMKIGRGEAEEVKITINGNELEQVHQFKYLGTLITGDGRSEREIKCGSAWQKRPSKNIRSCSLKGPSARVSGKDLLRPLFGVCYSMDLRPGP